MPKGPKGEKRPADVIGAAVKVMQIATGEIDEDLDDDGKNPTPGDALSTSVAMAKDHPPPKFGMRVHLAYRPPVSGVGP